VSKYRETERKYDAERALQLATVELPGVRRTDSPQQHLDATYYDTSDLRLLAAGITLRRRTGGEDAGWHLKIPSGSATRTEIHQPLEQKDDGLPARLRQEIRVPALGDDVRPVARIVTDRQVARLVDDDGAVLDCVVRVVDVEDAAVG